MKSKQAPQSKNTPGRSERKRGRPHFAAATEGSVVARASSPTPRFQNMDTNSRDRSNPSRSSKSNKAPRNNALILDFFGGVAKKPRAAPGIAPRVTRPRIMSLTEDTSSKEASLGAATSAFSSSSPREVDRLRHRLQQLEQSCKDKDEQLKAVANNQTIMHTAVKAALGVREKELDELKVTSERRASVSSRAIEMLIRSETARETAALREKLAVDSARLGRIVYTRAGMHAVESWEDGHASKQLRKRKAELRTKREALEKRQEAARRAAEFVRANKENIEANDASGEPPEYEEVGGIMVRDELSAMEAQESVRLHLATIQQNETALREEEHKLHNEKGVYVRNLKRVASEDSSRFKLRPKVC